MKFHLEFYHKGDVIDVKYFDELPYIPETGAVIYLQCENENMNVDGYYFKIIEKISLFFSTKNLRQKVMIKLEQVEEIHW